MCDSPFVPRRRTLKIRLKLHRNSGTIWVKTSPMQSYLRCMLVLYRYFTSSRSRDRAKKLGIHWLFMTIRFLVLGWIFCYCSDMRLYGCFCFSLFIQVECGSILESKCRTAVHYLQAPTQNNCHRFVDEPRFLDCHFGHRFVLTCRVELVFEFEARNRIYTHHGSLCRECRSLVCLPGIQTTPGSFHDID